MPSGRTTVNTSRSSSSSRGGPKKLSPNVRQAARASQMNQRGGSKPRGRKKKKEKVIGHRMERIAPPGGRTTINIGGYGEEAEGNSADSPSSMDVHVPRYDDGEQDRGSGARGGLKKAPVVEQLPLRPKTSAPERKINFGGDGHEYASYNPYNTTGNVIQVDDLPTDGLMITTPRGVPLKDCVNATRRQMDDAAARWTASDQTRIGGNAAKSARQLRQTAAAAAAVNNTNEFG
eukprot:CAMPEP_0195520450 /NCGR_PEP_ID=MMETSP0794_2-20130614/16911_1 /TAXON_ID=515487 /ORGANISM="Stephanopyxis turris, Strain CCMP 815" /LENGTH=232 /DNA_ID=CAMNT_0040649809 /DNA_START=185 /DNA_END=879 /DNA_ORIENTATION=-